jgi:hypothetical protein
MSMVAELDVFEYGVYIDKAEVGDDDDGDDECGDEADADGEKDSILMTCRS